MSCKIKLQELRKYLPSRYQLLLLGGVVMFASPAWAQADAAADSTDTQRQPTISAVRGRPAATTVVQAPATPPASAPVIEPASASVMQPASVPLMQPAPDGTGNRFFDQIIAGGVRVTLGGFIEAATIFRTRNEESDIGSSYNTGIPFENSPGWHQDEFRGSARQSRISLLVQGDVDPETHLTSYIEF